MCRDQQRYNDVLSSISVCNMTFYTDQGPPGGVAGEYRNVFTEFLGVPEEEVDAKLK